jgi:predicted CXXCH cytochrome family protein
VSDNKFQLRKATSGDQKEKYLPHVPPRWSNVPEKGSRHAALDMGCETCHVTHKTGARGTLEFDYHLTKSTPALCIDCHDVKDAGLQKAHQNQPFGTANCISCHDPHQSASPKLLRLCVRRLPTSSARRATPARRQGEAGTGDVRRFVALATTKS